MGDKKPEPAKLVAARALPRPAKPELAGWLKVGPLSSDNYEH